MTNIAEIKRLAEAATHFKEVDGALLNIEDCGDNDFICNDGQGREFTVPYESVTLETEQFCSITPIGQLEELTKQRNELLESLQATYAALDDASGVVDAGEDEEYAYQNVLTQAEATLNRIEEAIKQEKAK